MRHFRTFQDVTKHGFILCCVCVPLKSPHVTHIFIPLFSSLSSLGEMNCNTQVSVTDSVFGAVPFLKWPVDRMFCDVMTDVTTFSFSCIHLCHVPINASGVVKSCYEPVNVSLPRSCRRAEPQRVSDAEDVGHVVPLV